MVLGHSNTLVKNDSYKTNIKDIAMINLCNLPEPNIDFLSNILSITNDFKECERLIEQTFVNLYESRTGEKCISVKKLMFNY